MGIPLDGKCSAELSPSWSSPHDFVLEEALADSRLRGCHALTEVLGVAIAVLSEAGTKLQRSTTDAICRGAGAQDSLCDQEDVSVAIFGQSLFGACRGLGAALVGLAAALSGEVLTPLQCMHRDAEAKAAEKRKEMDTLRKRELLCSTALTESLQHRDKARAGLQFAIRERDRRERDKLAKGHDSLVSAKSSLGWLKPWKGDAKTSEAESKIHVAASLQTAAVEELAIRSDEAALARLQAQAASKAFGDALAQIDAAWTTLFRTSVGSCAAAWEEAGAALKRTSSQLREDANVIPSAQQARPKQTGSCGSVPEIPSPDAVSVSCVQGADLEMSMGEAAVTECDGGASDSPFTAPVLPDNFSKRCQTPTSKAGWASRPSPSASPSSSRSASLTLPTERHRLSSFAEGDQLVVRWKDDNPFEDADVELDVGTKDSSGGASSASAGGDQDSARAMVQGPTAAPTSSARRARLGKTKPAPPALEMIFD